MENDKIALLAAALKAIKRQEVYDTRLNEYAFANKLLFWGDELVIGGYSLQYRVSEYGKTWRLSKDDDLEEKDALLEDFERLLD